MPFSSVAQQRWAHTPAGVAALGGVGKVAEWDQATAHQPGGFKALPLRAPGMRGLENLSRGHAKQSPPNDLSQ